MPRGDMPAAEVVVDADLVRRLLRAQRPELAASEITLIASGWDNFSFRVGNDKVARFPRREIEVCLIGLESRWLPELAPVLPLPVPAPEFVGEAGEGYPWPWLMAPLLPGQSAAMVDAIDVERCAVQIAEFLTALHHPAPESSPENVYRGGPLEERDRATRARLDAVSDFGSRRVLEKLWDEALAGPAHEGDAVWLHGDLHPHNVLVVDRQISAVIDFGDITSGDPATDLAIAWSLVAPAQELFWDVYGGNEALEIRARGWAISLGLAYVANSADNPVMESIGDRTLRAVVDLA